MDNSFLFVLQLEHSPSFYPPGCLTAGPLLYCPALEAFSLRIKNLFTNIFFHVTPNEQNTVYILNPVNIQRIKMKNVYTIIVFLQITEE